MSDLSSSGGVSNNDTSMPVVIYVLYLTGFIFLLTPIVGLILAYVSKSPHFDWRNSHYDNAIHVFWKGIIYIVLYVLILAACVPLFMNEQIVGGIFVAVLATILSLAQMVWYIVRCVKGLIAVSQNRAYPDPESWGF